MKKILTLDKIDPQGLTHFQYDMYVTGSNVEAPEAIILRSFNLHTYEIPQSVKAIARAGAGVNNIPVDHCTERGIVVFNTPGANANGVKELILAALLLSSRNISGGIEWVREIASEGDQIPGLVEKGKKSFGGTEIKGKSIAVIGLGSIGLLLANASQMLGMQVIGFDPYLSVSQAHKLSDQIQLVRNLEAAIQNADFITLNIPLNPASRGYINREVIQKMKNGVKILNFARAELVNDTDMAEALEYGKIAAYVTDFPNEATLKMKNTICIPHLGASTVESETNCAIMAVDQVREYLENGNIINSVNFPDVELPFNGGTRILIGNRNIPTMVSQIVTILAREGANILNMVNKNKKDIAYNIIDIDKSDLLPGVEQELLNIDGVFLVRILN